MAKTNTIRSNSLQTNSVRLNGVEGLRRVSLQAGEIPDIPPTYTLSASVANGVVSATLNGVVVSLPFTANEGDVIVVEVTPNDGYEFNGWNDGNTDNPRTITMNADVVLSAECSEVVQPPVGNYIQFEDKAVEAICVANWSSDGIGLTEEDAAAVTSIGTTFKGNTEITSFDEFRYFTGVTSLEKQAFSGCSSLQSVGLQNIIAFGEQAFANCSSLVIEDLNLGGATTMGLAAFYGTKTRKVTGTGSIVTLGSTTTSSGTSGCFQNCTELTDVTLSEGLQNIGKHCFRDTAISSIIIPNSVKVIGGNAFNSCDNLTMADIGSGCESIGASTFEYCKFIEKLICRAATPPSLGAYVFRNTNYTFLIYVPDASLEAYKGAINWVSFADRIHPLSEIEGSPYIQFEDAEVESVLMAKGVSSDGIGITKEDAASVTSIGTWFKDNTAITSFDELRYFTGVTRLEGYAFFGCSNLQWVNLENIEEMNSQVFNSSGVVELVLPKIQKLVNSALVGMKNIAKVVIGASCTKIDGNNIWSWGSTTNVAFIVEGTTPPTLSTSNNKPDWYGVTFYVPDASVDAYKSAWSSWASRIKGISEYNG